MSGEGPEPSHDGGHSNILGPNSYTTQRLNHATPEHLHITSRRCFIGPIPEGWLKSHRKEWYKHYLHINYSSRAATFSTSAKFSRLRQISGLEGPSVSAIHGQSFPQPEDVQTVDESLDDEDEEEEDGAGKVGTTTSAPAVSVPRAKDSHQDSALQGIVASSKGPDNPTGNPNGADLSPSPTQSQKIVTNDESSRADQITEPSVGAVAEQAPTDEAQPGQRQPSSTSSSKAVSGSNERTSSSVQGTGSGEASDSKASLIQHGKSGGSKDSNTKPKSILSKITPKQSAVHGSAEESRQAGTEEPTTSQTVATGLVRFNIPQEEASDVHRHNEEVARLSHRRTLRQRRKSKERDGEIVKVERMLVRVDTTAQQLSDEFNENESMRIETRTIEKWREFIVVCRESASDEADLTIQLYKSRVIPTIQRANVQKQTNHVIPLKRKTTHINLYSSLDKTLAIWVPHKRGSMIYIMRPRSATSSVEWYTFLRASLGWNRSKEVQVNVPDLSVTLKLENPFEKLEAQRDAAREADKEGEDKAIMQTMREEQAVAGEIIKRCLVMLERKSEWAEVLNTWMVAEKIGLAWKKYDRLEWIHGTNEQKMYGTIAMQKSHDLELRPKLHYPTKVPVSRQAAKVSSVSSLNSEINNSTRSSFDRQSPSQDDDASTKESGWLTEPPPVEGFLIRLTSQRGRDQRLGRMFYKRLYFSTHNQYLTFCRPAKGVPPPPPKLAMTPKSNIPSTQEIINTMPMIYGVAPFALDERGHVRWLSSARPQDQATHDHDAFDEAERQVNNLLKADGYVDLCNVDKIRDVVRGSTPADSHIQQGDQVDFHEEVDDSRQDDGTTEMFDDGRTFEMVMKNGLMVRLEAYDKDTKKEWIIRLRSLSRYWQLRKSADLDLMKSVRQSNLDKLHIDEEFESYLGQFGEKWEVSQSVASAELFNMCGASSCRTITISGNLYRKPRRHSTFKRCGVILCHGQLLIFQSSLRKRTGEEIPYAHHERQVAIDLRDCYVYSGLVTEGDLLYQNRTFDSNHPGRHALPRVYPSDGWTSTDEDTTTCFVVWHGRRGSLFRANEETVGGKKSGHLRSVTQLGVPGRSIVFKTRSRAERDHWVMSVGLEIERLQQTEDIRLVNK